MCFEGYAYAYSATDFQTNSTVMVPSGKQLVTGVLAEGEYRFAAYYIWDADEDYPIAYYNVRLDGSSWVFADDHNEERADDQDQRHCARVACLHLEEGSHTFEIYLRTSDAGDWVRVRESTMEIWRHDP